MEKEVDWSQEPLRTLSEAKEDTNGDGNNVEGRRSLDSHRYAAQPQAVPVQVWPVMATRTRGATICTIHP